MLKNIPLRWSLYLLIVSLPAVLFFTTMSWVDEHLHREIKKSETWLGGLHKVRGLYEVMKSLQRIRGLDNYAIENTRIPHLSEWREQEHQQLRAYLSLMLAESVSYNRSIHVSFEQLSHKIIETADAEWTDPSQRFRAYTRLIDELQELIATIGDMSLAAVDTNHHQHVHADRYIRLLPWLTESIGRLRGQSSLLQQTELADAQYFELRHLILQLQDRVEQYASRHQQVSHDDMLFDEADMQLVGQLIEGSLDYSQKLLTLLNDPNQRVNDLSLFDEGSKLIELIDQQHKDLFHFQVARVESHIANLYQNRDRLMMVNIIELIAIYLGLLWAAKTISTAFRRLKASEYFLQRVLNTIPARVFWKDKDLNYLGCNSLFAKDAGLEQAAKVVGLDDFSMPWKEEAERFRIDDQDVMNNKQAKLHYEERQQRQSGEVSWLETSKIPLENDRGETIGVLGVYEDITERKQAEIALVKSELRLRSVLDTMADALITIDQHGIVQEFNLAAEHIFGYRTDEVVGKNVNLLMPEPYRSEHDAHIANYLKSGKARFIGVRREIVARRSNGEIFPIELAIAEVKEEGMWLFSGIIRDISEKKYNERLKSEFVSTVSHELRTPLTAIRGSLGLLKNGAIGELDEKAQKMLELASNNTERLLLLINDILDIQKIEEDQISIELTSEVINPVIERAVQECQYLTSQYGVSYAVEADDELEAIIDSNCLSKVLVNLLSNAAKFSPQGGVVTIRLTRLSRAIARISVEDHGQGIPLAFQDKIYEKFTQGDSSDTREKGGTGLGMSIAKALTEKMRGEISFETSEGQGTVFHIDLRTM